MSVCQTQRERKNAETMPKAAHHKVLQGYFPSFCAKVNSFSHVCKISQWLSHFIENRHKSWFIQFLSIKKVQTKLENVVWYYQLKYWVRPKNVSLYHYPMSLYFDNVICLAYIQQSFSNWEKKIQLMTNIYQSKPNCDKILYTGKERIVKRYRSKNFENQDHESSIGVTYGKE